MKPAALDVDTQSEAKRSTSISIQGEDGGKIHRPDLSRHITGHPSKHPAV
jgi:hypothetical protein